MQVQDPRLLEPHQAGLRASLCGGAAGGGPGRRDGTGRGVAALRPVRGDRLEGSHRPAAEAPGPEPERHVPRPDPVLYEVLFIFKCPKSV